MVECNFTYTNELLDKISRVSTKKINLISEIAIGIILIGVFVLFATSNILLGFIFLAIFAMLLVSIIFINRSIIKSNRMLLNQNISIVFNEENMKMKAIMGDRVVYSASFEYSAVIKVENLQELTYVYFNKSSVIVIPKSSFQTQDDYEKAMQLVANNYVI